MIKRNQEEAKILGKIANCKYEIGKLDYYTNKWVEGKITETRWNEIVAERDKYRDEINALEMELEILRKS